MRKVTCVSEPSNVLSVRDYTEGSYAHFNLEIQLDHSISGRPLSIECCNIELVDSYQKLQS